MAQIFQGLTTILNDVWDAINHVLRVGVGGAGSFTQISQTFSAPGQSVSLDVRGYSAATIELVNDANWSGVVSFLGSSDGINYRPIYASILDGQQTGVVAYLDHSSFGAGVTSIWRLNVAGLRSLQAVAAFANSGTTTVTLTAAPGNGVYTPINPPNSNLQSANFPAAAIYVRQFEANEYILPAALSTDFAFSYGAGTSSPMLMTTGVQYIANMATSKYDVVRGIAVFRAAAATASGSTALWAPAAGKRFRLMRYRIDITDDATLAAGGRLTVSLLDGAASTAQNLIAFVPAAALDTAGLLATTGWIDLGNGVLSAAANNVLNINLSAALTAGIVNVIACGTEE